MSTHVHAMGRPELAPYPVSDRFRHDVAYFMTIPGTAGVPELPPGEYWVRLDEARRWLDEGALAIISPLDSENRTEVELSEEHEAWLEWMTANLVEHIRVE